MGWTGNYMNYNPSMKERQEYFERGMTFTNNCTDDNGNEFTVTSTIVKSTIRGSLIHGIQKIEDSRDGSVKFLPVTMLTSYRNREFLEKTVNPMVYYHDYPITWIDKLTPDDYMTVEKLHEWKDNINAHNKRRKAINQSPRGTTMKHDIYGTLRYNGRRWINPEGYYIPKNRLYHGQFTVDVAA